METTYLSLCKLAVLYKGTQDLDQATLEYQRTNDPIIISFVFVKWYPYILTQAEKYFYLTEEDKASVALEELHKAMKDFDSSKGARIQTLFSVYLNNRLRAETQMVNHQKRRCNNGADSYENVANSFSGYNENGYSSVELLDLLEHCQGLSNNEIRYCKIVMQYQPETVKDTDIATALGISCAAINYIKKSLQKKLGPLLV